MFPTSLYIHVPWCIKKCPYCDFNSHQQQDASLPETTYLNALLEDFTQDVAQWPRQTLHTIFIGGGTPSLLSGEFYFRLLEAIAKQVPFNPQIEITMEANPGTVEQKRFKEYRQAGINRLSLGIQSFDPTHLQRLGRIHDEKQAHRAIETAREAGFSNINVDIMYNLPEQTVAAGLNDLNQALAYQPEHLSWYEFTIEPNTYFFKHPPKLPIESTCEAIEEQGRALLQDFGMHRYEISAYARSKQHQSQHNMNYWLFGDYYGIGAGAHGKLTGSNFTQILRTQKHRQPRDYLDPHKQFLTTQTNISKDDRIFEFVLNSSRLEQSIPYTLFTERTGLPIIYLEKPLQIAEQKGLVICEQDSWAVTTLGRKFTNDLQSLFLLTNQA
mgnify:CR=1 FL=1